MEEESAWCGLPAEMQWRKVSDTLRSTNVRSVPEVIPAGESPQFS
jgi:hypothetical protein